MFQRYISILLFSLSTPLFSAGPTLHLWTAEKYCQIRGITDEETIRQIIIGTEFPDIRYITPISREQTHPIVSDISQITGTPFEIGMKIHSWLDTTRENLIQQEVYDAIAPYAQGHSYTLLKFVEEEILADFYDGTKWLSTFNDILADELPYAPEATIAKWHDTIQWTLTLRPSWLLWGQSYRGRAFGLSETTLYDWSYLLPKLKHKPLFKTHLQTLLTHIETKLLYQNNMKNREFD